LPGLYELDRDPTPAMLRMGHVPPYTDNPFVLATLAARYNEVLRELARTEPLVLIDLDAWSREALEPREHYFFDSVHLTDEGQAMLGRYLAARLHDVLAGHPATVSRQTDDRRVLWRSAALWRERFQR